MNHPTDDNATPTHPLVDLLEKHKAEVATLRERIAELERERDQARADAVAQADLPMVGLADHKALVARLVSYRADERAMALYGVMIVAAASKEPGK